MPKEELTPEMFDCLTQYDEMRKRNPIKLMARISNTIKARGHDFLNDEGFSDVQMWYGAVLGNLDPEGTNINTLAQRANMTKQAISKLVKELSRKKYVTLSTDLQDKRAVKVMFTAEGIRLLEQMGRYAYSIAIHLKNMLGDKRYELLIDDLVTIEKNMNGG